MGDIEVNLLHIRDGLGLFRTCTYCSGFIEDIFIEISINKTFRQRFCMGECWDQYIIGIALINDKVIALEERKVN